MLYAVCAVLLLLLTRPGAARGGAKRVERPSRTDPALRDYGNTNVWPLPASAAGVCDGTLDPQAFQIVVAQPADDPYLLEVARRFLPV